MTLVTLTPKPTAAKEVQDNVVDILKTYLEKANKGEVNYVIVIAGFTDNTWTHDMSSTLDFPRAIGVVEIAKQEWIEEQNQED